MQNIMTFCKGVCCNSEVCRHIDEILSARPITEFSLHSANKTSCNENISSIFLLLYDTCEYCDAIQVDTPANPEFKFLAQTTSIMGVPLPVAGAVSSYSGVASPCRFPPVRQVTMSPLAIRVASCMWRGEICHRHSMYQQFYPDLCIKQRKYFMIQIRMSIILITVDQLAFNDLINRCCSHALLILIIILNIC